MSIYQGNRALARYNTLLGTFHFIHQQPSLRYRSAVRLTFRLDELLLLHVSAGEDGTISDLQTASFQVRPDSDGEVEPGQDEEEVAYLETKDAAEQCLHEIMSALQGKQLSADQVPSLYAAIVSLEAMLTTNERPNHLQLEAKSIVGTGEFWV
jgi:molecular chaperone DnaK (HSP70)